MTTDVQRGRLAEVGSLLDQHGYDRRTPARSALIADVQALIADAEQRAAAAEEAVKRVEALLLSWNTTGVPDRAVVVAHLRDALAPPAPDLDCLRCEGTGAEPDADPCDERSYPCQACHGTGTVPAPAPQGEPCPECNGSLMARCGLPCDVCERTGTAEGHARFLSCARTAP